MAKGKDILGMYGPNSSQPMAKRAKGGGDMPERDVMNYRPPSIPGWDPKGSVGPGIGGVNYGNCGTQGPKAIKPESGGMVGLGGEKLGMGTNRKG